MDKMITLTAENTVLFPLGTEKHKAPSCFESEKLWFELKRWDPSMDKFDADCIDALIAEGVGVKACPTDGENAALCIIGGIIAALTGKYLVFPKKLPQHFNRVSEHDTWEILWAVAEDRKKDTNISFLASMLRMFLPRQHDPLIDRPYYESFFLHRWRFLAYPITFSNDPQRICPQHIERGKKAMRRLPPLTAAAIQEAAWHIPTMLMIATKRFHLP